MIWISVTDPGCLSRIQDLRSGSGSESTENLSTYFLNIIRDVYPRSRIPYPDSFHPESRIQVITSLDSGSGAATLIWISLSVRNNVCDWWRGGERGCLENGRVLPVWLESASFLALWAWKVGTCLFTLDTEKTSEYKENWITYHVPVPDFCEWFIEYRYAFFYPLLLNNCNNIQICGIYGIGILVSFGMKQFLFFVF
jgi:hypothetical protein